MKAEAIKEKIISKQYLNKITPHLYHLINDHRIARKVWKIEILEKYELFMYGVITKAFLGVVTQMILLENFLGIFYIIIKNS